MARLGVSIMRHFPTLSPALDPACVQAYRVPHQIAQPVGPEWESDWRSNPNPNHS